MRKSFSLSAFIKLPNGHHKQLRQGDESGRVSWTLAEFGALQTTLLPYLLLLLLCFSPTSTKL